MPVVTARPLTFGVFACARVPMMLMVLRSALRSDLTWTWTDFERDPTRAFASSSQRRVCRTADHRSLLCLLTAPLLLGKVTSLQIREGQWSGDRQTMDCKALKCTASGSAVLCGRPPSRSTAMYCNRLLCASCGRCPCRRCQAQYLLRKVPSDTTPSS